MLEVVETIYQNGAFVPQKNFDLPEGTRVKITIEYVEEELNLNVEESTITDLVKRQKNIAKFLERTASRTISENAPRKFTREELNERR